MIAPKSDSKNSQGEKSSIGSESTKASANFQEITRHGDLKIGNHNSGKIITIEDNDSPLYKPIDSTRKAKKLMTANFESSSGVRQVTDTKDFDVDEYFKKVNVKVNNDVDLISKVDALEVNKGSKERKIMGQIASNKNSNDTGFKKNSKGKRRESHENNESQDEFRPFSFGERDNPNRKDKENKKSN